LRGVKVNSKLNRYLGGLAIIIIGVILLLRNLDFFYFDESYVVAVVFGLLGIFFYGVYLKDDTKWWAAIPGAGGLIVFISIFISNIWYIPDGFIGAGVVWIVASVFSVLYLRDKTQKWALIVTTVLLAAGMIVFLSVFVSETRFIPDEFIGTGVVWIISLVFIGVFLRDKKNWWALIPGGVLISVGFTVLAGEVWYFHDESVAFVLFLGFALTFLLLYMLKNAENKLDWAKYPAIVLGVFSFFLLFVSPDNFVGDVLFPIVIILFGSYMVVKNYSAKEEKVSNNNSVVQK